MLEEASTVDTILLLTLILKAMIVGNAIQTMQNKINNKLNMELFQRFLEMSMLQKCLYVGYCYDLLNASPHINI